MSNASNRNLGSMVRERDRRTALSLDSPGTPGIAQAGYLSPSWDAFYGSLREQGDAAGGGYRLSGNGLEGTQGGGTTRPGDEDIARTWAVNTALGDMNDQRRVQDQSLRAMTAGSDIAQAQASQAQRDLADRDAMDRGLAPTAAPTRITRTHDVNAGDSITMRPAGQVDPRQMLLNSLPGHMRPQMEQTLAAMDEKKAAAALATRKQTEVERENRSKDAASAPFVPPIDPATGAPLMGDALLKTLPQSKQTLLTRVIEGKQAIPTGAALKDPYWKDLIETAGLVDPTFDTVNYNARNKAFTDLSSPSGAGGKTIGALNTAASHIGKLSDLVEKLDNFDTPMANRMRNPILSETGDTRVTNFNVNQPQTMKEIESLWKASGGTQADIDKLKESLGPNMGKTQQREALVGFADLMLGKLESTQQQRDSVLGPVASQKVPILFEKSMPALRQIYERAGKAVPEILRGKTAAAPPPPAGGTIRARDPQGNLHEAKAGTPLPAGWKMEGG